MPSDPRKRQKKLEKRAAKRKEKKHIKVRKESGGMPAQVEMAVRFPLLHCLISSSIEAKGIGPVIVARQLPNRTVLFASFLVDTKCLGVKDVYLRLVDQTPYETDFMKLPGDQYRFVETAPATAKKFVEGAVAFARSYGLKPHADYDLAMQLFGSVDANESTEEFQYGDEVGKPFFIAGPYDTPGRCNQVLAALRETAGEGNYNFLIPLGDPTRGMEELEYELGSEEDDDRW